VKRLVQQIDKTYTYPSLVGAPEPSSEAPAASPASLTGLLE